MEMSKILFVWDRSTKAIFRLANGVFYVLSAAFLAAFIAELVRGTFSVLLLMVAALLPLVTTITAMLLCTTKVRVYANRIEIIYPGHALKASDTFVGDIEMLPAEDSDAFCEKHKIDRAVCRVSRSSNDSMDFQVIVPNKT